MPWRVGITGTLYRPFGETNGSRLVWAIGEMGAMRRKYTSVSREEAVGRGWPLPLSSTSQASGANYLCSD